MAVEKTSQDFFSQTTFIINGQDEKTKTYLEGLEIEKTVLQCDRNLTAGEARNFGIRQMKPWEDFQWVLFFDDDIQLPQDYFERAFATLGEFSFNIDVLGGPEICFPDGSLFQKAYGFCQGEFMVTGHTYWRHRAQEGLVRRARENYLILCNLWVKSSLFQEGFYFPSLYERNEENIFLNRLEKSGREIFYSPSLFVFHRKKESLLEVMYVTFVSGHCRARSFYEHSQSFHFLFLVPALFILYLLGIVTVFLLIGWSSLFFFFLSPLISYGFICVFLSGKCFLAQEGGGRGENGMVGIDSQSHYSLELWRGGVKGYLWPKGEGEEQGHDLEVICPGRKERSLR